MTTKSTSATLEAAFRVAEASHDFDVHIEFKDMLLAADNPEGAAYHFELLERTNNDSLLEILAQFFKWRGKSGEAYLIDKLAVESNPFLIAVALQILGAMRSTSAAAFARNLISHGDERVRERACFVLGWVGTRKDLFTLRKVGLDDSSANVRKWAATQQMHIWLRYPACKRAVVAYLNEAIHRESDGDVIETIIYTTQEVLRRRFGSKVGKADLAEAKRKAAVALSNQVNKK